MFNELKIHLCAYESVLNFADLIGDDSVDIATEGVGTVINKIWTTFVNFFVNIYKWIKNFVATHLGKTLVHAETYTEFEKFVADEADRHTTATNILIKNLQDDKQNEHSGEEVYAELRRNDSRFYDDDKADYFDIDHKYSPKLSQYRVLNKHDIVFITSKINTFEKNGTRVKSMVDSIPMSVLDRIPYSFIPREAMRRTTILMKWFVAMQYRKTANDKIVHLNEGVTVTLDPVTQY